MSCDAGQAPLDRAPNLLSFTSFPLSTPSPGNQNEAIVLDAPTYSAFRHSYVTKFQDVGNALVSTATPRLCSAIPNLDQSTLT